MTHTPGPWRIGKSGAGIAAVYPKDARRHAPICFLGSGTIDDTEDFSNAEANAHLIAAAPDLLEASEQAERELARVADKEPQAVIALVAVRAAIAKANGEFQPEERKENAAN
jgi:hypothetical protein